jgi:DNA polymerase III epsilon subunit-like protein
MEINMNHYLVKSVSIKDYYSAKFGKSNAGYGVSVVEAETPQNAREVARQKLIKESGYNNHHITSVEDVSFLKAGTLIVNIDPSLPWWEANLVSCDVETTGLSSKDNSIIELAFCNYNKETKKFDPTKNYLLNEGDFELSDKITEITGITKEDIEGKPKFGDIYDEIFELFLNKPNTILIFHNRGFDVGFIKESIRRIGSADDYFPPSVCSMEMALHALDLKKNKLFMVAEELGVEGQNSHRASDDACLAGDVFMEMCRKEKFFTRKDCDISQFLTFFDSKTDHI